MNIHSIWTCPRCGAKMRQIDQLVTAEDERMRRKKCPLCSEEIYTVEFEIDYDQWKENHSKYNRQKEYHRRHGKNYVEQAV